LKEIKDDHSNLRWSTSAEINSKGFDIERSMMDSTLAKSPTRKQQETVQPREIIPSLTGTLPRKRITIASNKLTWTINLNIARSFCCGNQVLPMDIRY
jgi:hypothetical protein